MIFVVISGFALALIIPLLVRFSRNPIGWVVALLPLGLAVYFSTYIRDVSEEGPLLFTYPWVSSLSVKFSFCLDGLSLLFAMIITGIGVMIMIYANAYFSGKTGTARFYAYILSFMASMLGTVLANNIILLYVFWELTSLWSYLLIGFDHDRIAARKAALQALLMTVSGGLALLAGLMMLGAIAGSYEISTILERGSVVRNHPLYLPVLILMLLGAFTKSAQFPFHFWLPNAMEAPTPVSAYLHSATMVNAGIYLLARMYPVLGGTFTWQVILITVGAASMLMSSSVAIIQSDIKKILAYSTVSVLGALVFLLGHSSKQGFEAAMAYLLIHCLYKAGLFLVAGIVDHETGTRDVNSLGGLFRFMPVTAMAAALACLSMAGLPPLFGFIGKELLYEATMEGPTAAYLLTIVAVSTNILLVAVAGIFGFGPFFGKTKSFHHTPHEPPTSMWLGPVLLGILGLIIGLFPNPVASILISPAVAVIVRESVSMELGLMHGFTIQLLLSGLTFTLGLAAYYKRKSLRKLISFLDFGKYLGPARAYEGAVKLMNSVARLQTRFLQSGHLHFYLLIIIVTIVGLVGFSFMGQVVNLELERFHVASYEGIVALIIFLATLVTVTARSRLLAIVALGVVGYSVTLIYVLFGAPDLAMTQFSIDTLTVILLVLVLFRLPRYQKYSVARERLRDGMTALVFGGLVTVLALVATNAPTASTVSSYFAENSYLLAKGRNIVNVILVDFRALDTMGEITVLAAAAMGVYSLLKLRLEEKK